MKPIYTLILLLFCSISNAQTDGFSIIQSIEYKFDSNGINTAPVRPGLDKPKRVIIIQGQARGKVNSTMRLYFAEELAQGNDIPQVSLNPNGHSVSVFYNIDRYEYFLTLLNDKERLTISYNKAVATNPNNLISISKRH
ncbi:hypothetical protein [Flagellimonas sp.]|uniref:hypothetical protein n=1 Tax=Flagellimonas sp. TaxID=2058762 RepID=UPI003BB06FA5